MVQMNGCPVCRPGGVLGDGNTFLSSKSSGSSSRPKLRGSRFLDS